jgi:hypothetical protein
MAVFKTLRPKAQDYVFKYEGNERLQDPARAVFARFPLPDENFLRRGETDRYGNVDFGRIGKKDTKEIEKLFGVFINSYLADMVSGGVPAAFSRVDVPAFARECVDHFENLWAEDGQGKKRAVKTVDDFLGLPGEAVYEIAKDLYAYARDKDQFTMGESKA